MLEKGCQHKNGGSITIIPVVENKGGDITDYISTNIISITDGQIVLSSKNFNKGQNQQLIMVFQYLAWVELFKKESMKILGAKVEEYYLIILKKKYMN